MLKIWPCRSAQTVAQAAQASSCGPVRPGRGSFQQSIDSSSMSGEAAPFFVSVGQMAGCGGSTEERLAIIDRLARKASAESARLLVLPEMSLTGYELRHGLDAHRIPGPLTAALSEVARQADLYIVAGATELDGADLYNTLAMVGPDGYVGRYRKVHVSAVETAFWRSGGQGQVLDSDIGRVGFGICADMLFATPWRSYASAVDLVVIGSAWPNHRYTRPFPYGDWFSTVHLAGTQDVPKHLSKSLGVPVLLANAARRFQARLPPLNSQLQGQFAGRSCIVDGDVVAAASSDETLLVGAVRTERRKAEGSLEPWLPQWSPTFRMAGRGGDVALGFLYRLFYKRQR